MSLLAAVAAACVTAANARGWYAGLARPPYVPLRLSASLWGLLIGLHLAMGAAAWLVWRRPLKLARQRSAMIFWGWLLALGAAWPAAFFGLHLLLPGLFLAAAFAGCAALTLRRFASMDRIAPFLLAPYLGFALAALYLNTGFWWLNR